MASCQRCKTYSTKPYGHEVYHLAAILSNMANPVACFFGLAFLPRSWLSLFLLTSVGSALAVFVVGLASMSPTPTACGPANWCGPCHLRLDRYGGCFFLHQGGFSCCAPFGHQHDMFMCCRWQQRPYFGHEDLALCVNAAPLRNWAQLWALCSPLDLSFALICSRKNHPVSIIILRYAVNKWLVPPYTVDVVKVEEKSYVLLTPHSVLLRQSKANRHQQQQ